MKKLIKATVGSVLFIALGGGLLLFLTGLADGFVWDHRLREVDGTSAAEAEEQIDDDLDPAGAAGDVKEHDGTWVRWRASVLRIRRTRAGVSALALEAGDGTRFGAVGRSLPDGLETGDPVVVVGKLRDVVVRVRSAEGDQLPTVLAATVRSPTTGDDVRDILDTGERVIDGLQDAAE